MDYADIVQVKKVGMRDCNLYLAANYRLLFCCDETEGVIPTQQGANFYVKKRIMFVVGRTESVPEFTPQRPP